jgi:hypothetical protein
MRPLLILLALSITCRAVEPLPFYGKPRPVFREFWTGVQEMSVNTPPFKRRCRDFAARHTPEATIPEMLRDFAQYPGETKGFVYSWIMSAWPRKKVMRILTPYMNSRDRNMSHIASNFYADFESPE